MKCFYPLLTRYLPATLLFPLGPHIYILVTDSQMRENVLSKNNQMTSLLQIYTLSHSYSGVARAGGGGVEGGGGCQREAIRFTFFGGGHIASDTFIFRRIFDIG